MQITTVNKLFIYILHVNILNYIIFVYYNCRPFGISVSDLKKKYVSSKFIILKTCYCRNVNSDWSEKDIKINISRYLIGEKKAYTLLILQLHFPQCGNLRHLSSLLDRISNVQISISHLREYRRYSAAISTRIHEGRGKILADNPNRRNDATFYPLIPYWTSTTIESDWCRISFRIYI